MLEVKHVVLEFLTYTTPLSIPESLCQKQSTYLPSIKLSSRLLVTSCSQIFHCHYTQLMLHQTNSSVKFRSEERHDDSRMGWCTGDVSSISQSNGFLLYMVRTYHQPFVKLTIDGLCSPHSVMNSIFRLTAREATYTVLIKYVEAIHICVFVERGEIYIHFIFSLPLSHLKTKTTTPSTVVQNFFPHQIIPTWTYTPINRYVPHLIASYKECTLQNPTKSPRISFGPVTSR